MTTEKLERLKKLSLKMMWHYIEINERMWEHHGTTDRQESCRRCNDYSLNYWRWNRRWWELSKLIKREEASRHGTGTVV